MIDLASPTQRTLKRLREEGYLTEVVERWNPHANIRQDLFGWIDIIAIRPGEILAVQATSYSNHSARVTKLKQERREQVEEWLDAGGLAEVWSWKSKQRILKDGTVGKSKVWRPRVTKITDC